MRRARLLIPVAVLFLATGFACTRRTAQTPAMPEGTTMQQPAPAAPEQAQPAQPQPAQPAGTQPAPGGTNQ